MAKERTTGESWLDRVYKEIGGNDINVDVKQFLSTGFLPLNYAIAGKYRNGGFPVGRISEMFGPASSGKTLQATMAMRETQKLGGLAVMLDFEHAFSLSRAKALGLSDDPSKFIFKQPETAEKGFAIIELIANEVRKFESDKPITVVIDSVASMVTEAEMAAGYDEVNMKTRLSLPVCMSDSLKKLAPLVNNTGITLLFLNQTRDNPGVMFGDKKTTPGGNAMKFYASVRGKLTKTGKIKEDSEIVGENVEVEIIKDKVSIPFRTCSYQSSFTEGINLYASHIAALNDLGMMGDTKGWVEFDGKKYRMKELEEALRADDGMYEALLSMFPE